jgi:hypothetical protein
MKRMWWSRWFGSWLLVAAALGFEGAAHAADLAVTDELDLAIFRVNRATGNRSILSGCSGTGCPSQVGSGPALQHPLGLIQRADGSLLESDGPGKALFRVDPLNGNRTVLSGCANYPTCSSIVGTGINLVVPTDAAAAGSSLVVTDFRAPDQGTVLLVDSATGNRTALSGCANDACSSVVGSGRPLRGVLGVVRTSSGQIYVFDRDASNGNPAAVVAIDPANGNRTVISGCIDAACSSFAGSGPPLSFLNPGAVAADGSLLAVAITLDAVLRIDPATGNRSIVSGCTDAGPCGGPPVGSGPAFVDPVAVKRDASGDLLVTDSGTFGVTHVDPTTGDRTVITSSAVGTGPSFQVPVSAVDLPEPRMIAGLLASLAMVALLARRRA